MEFNPNFTYTLSSSTAENNIHHKDNSQGLLMETPQYQI
jgi:hypothetical protein